MVLEIVKAAAFHAFPQPLKYSVFQSYVTSLGGHAVEQLVEALRYKPEGRGFDS